MGVPSEPGKVHNFSPEDGLGCNLGPLPLFDVDLEGKVNVAYALMDRACRKDIDIWKTRQ